MIARLFVNREFTLLWVGRAASSFGEYLVAATVVVWFADGLLKGAAVLPTAIAAVVLASSIPRLLVAPFVGALIDRWHPRTTMLVCDALRALVMLALTGLVVRASSASLLVPAILLALIVVNVAAQFFTPARAAAMQVVIPDERRVGASSLGMFSTLGVAAVATGLGPVLFSTIGPLTSLIVDAVALFVSFTCVAAACVPRPREYSVRSRYWSDFRAGFFAAWRIRSVRYVVVGVAAYGLSTGVNSAVLALFALRTLGLPPEGYGVVAAAFSVGGVAGVAIVPWLVRRLGALRIFSGSIVALGATYVGYAINRDFLAAVTLMALAGVLFSIYITVQGPILQAATPVGMMGRITSVTTPTLAIASVIGSW